MAANLIEIKSRSLLPLEKRDEASDVESEETSLEDLQKRLLDYDRFQKAGSHLFQQASHLDLTVSNNEWLRLEPQYEHIEAPLRGDSSVLLILYEQMLGVLSERRPVSVNAMTESITVDKIMEKIDLLIKENQFLMFQGLYSKMKSRYELVASVLAALQMVRDRKLHFFQDEHMGPLWLYDNKMQERDLLSTQTFGEQNSSFDKSRSISLLH